MQHQSHINLAFAIALLAVGPLMAATPDAGVEFFETNIRPVLVSQCFDCHSAQAKKLKGGLRLESRGLMVAGGDLGPAMGGGKPEKSRLIEAIGYGNADLQMPPKSRLTPAQVADFTKWVAMGAPW